MPPGVGPCSWSRRGGAGSWMLSFPPPLSPSSSFSFAAVGEGEQKKNTISLFKPKQTHSGLRFNMNLWNAGMMSGGRAPLRRAGRRGGAVPMGTAPLSSTPLLRRAHGVRRNFWTAPHGRPDSAVGSPLPLHQPAWRLSRLSRLALQRAWPAD